MCVQCVMTGAALSGVGVAGLGGARGVLWMVTERVRPTRPRGTTGHIGYPDPRGDGPREQTPSTPDTPNRIAATRRDLELDEGR